jgi:hypothetical protein
LTIDLAKGAQLALNVVGNHVTQGADASVYASS